MHNFSSNETLIGLRLSRIAISDSKQEQECKKNSSPYCDMVAGREQWCNVIGKHVEDNEGWRRLVCIVISHWNTSGIKFVILQKKMSAYVKKMHESDELSLNICLALLFLIPVKVLSFALFQMMMFILDLNSFSTLKTKAYVQSFLLSTQREKCQSIFTNEIIAPKALSITGSLRTLREIRLWTNPQPQLTCQNLVSVDNRVVWLAIRAWVVIGKLANA